MTIEVVDSPDILVTLTGPSQVSVTVTQGGAGGITEIDEATPTALTGWLRGNGSTVNAHSFISVVDTSDNVFIVEQDGPKDGFLDAISNNNYYAQFVSDNTGAKQFRFRTEYAGYGFGGCSADITAGYLDGGAPVAGIGACNGTATSSIGVTGPKVTVSANNTFEVFCQGMQVTFLGDLYNFSETGFELCSVVDDATLTTKLVDDCGMATKAYADASAANALNDAEIYADGLIASLVAASPATLDTLDEIAAALGDDPNFAATITAALGNRVRFDINNQGLSSQEKTNAKTNIALENVPNTDTTNPANITQNSSYRFATDAEKTSWNAKQAALGFTPLNPTNNLSELASVATAKANLLLGDPTEALRGSYHLLPLPSRPRWDIMENIPSSATGSGFGMGGNDWSISTGNVLSHPGTRTGTTYATNRARTNCIGPTPVAGTQMAQLRHATRSPLMRSSVSDTFGYLMFRMPTLPALSQGWAGWKNLAAEHAATAVLQNTVNCIAMGYEQSGGTYEPNWYLYHNDGSGTCTRIDLGSNFPTNIAAVYCFYICMQANSGNIAYQINRLDVPAVTSGLISSNLPLIDNPLMGHLYQSNGSTAVRCEVESYHHFAAIKN
jgi:hypothetical protein